MALGNPSSQNGICFSHLAHPDKPLVIQSGKHCKNNRQYDDATFSDERLKA
jgi:hypothetical protein